MPTREQATMQKVIKALEPQAISSDTTTTGAIIDTADFDGGVYFAVDVYAYTDGTYVLKIEDGDDSGLSDAADVATAQLVYGSLPSLTAAIAEGGVLAKEGVHSTKRYLRASIVSTSTATGASLQVIAVLGAEVLKTAQDS
jgi:hypothetical protein